MKEAKTVGQTKDAGFQIGLRKTFPISADTAWDFLFSNEGLATWLGELMSSDVELNKTYKTKDGIEGKIKILKPLSHVRLTWKKKNWTNVSTVQIRVISAKDKTTISFHQEKLLNSAQRDEMKNHWADIMDKVSKKMATIYQLGQITHLT